MRRIALLLPGLLMLLAPAGASASSRFVYDIPKLVEKPLVAVKKATDIPVLLPSKMTTEFKKLYSAGRGRKTRYHTGWFQPSRCGASCASPGIEWEQGGVLYELEAKLGTQKTERKTLTRLANSAIRSGAR